MDSSDIYHPSVIEFMGDLLHTGTVCSLDEILRKKAPNSILVGRIIAIFPLVEVSSERQKENVLVYHLKEVYSIDKYHRKEFKVIFVGEAALVVNNYRFQVKDYLAFYRPHVTRNFSFERANQSSRRVLIVGLGSLNRIEDIHYRKREMNSWRRIEPGYGLNSASLSESPLRHSMNSSDENTNTRNQKLGDKRNIAENVVPESLPKRKKSNNVCNINETTESLVPCETIESHPISEQEQPEHISQIDMHAPGNSKVLVPTFPKEQNDQVSNIRDVCEDIEPLNSPSLTEPIREHIQLPPPSPLRENTNACSDFNPVTSSSPIEERTDIAIVPAGPVPSCSNQYRTNAEKLTSICNGISEDNDESILMKWPTNELEQEFVIEAYLVITIPPITEKSAEMDILSFVKGYCDICVHFFSINRFQWVYHEGSESPICPNCKMQGRIRDLRHTLMFHMILKDNEENMKEVLFLDEFAEKVLGCSVYELCDSIEARMKATMFINSCRYEEEKENIPMTVKVSIQKGCDAKLRYIGTGVEISKV